VDKFTSEGNTWYMSNITKNKHTRITWNPKEPVSRSPEESGVFWKWKTSESGVSGKQI